MTDNQPDTNQPPPKRPPKAPPTEVNATPPWADPFEYVEVKGAKGDRVERRDIRNK